MMSLFHFMCVWLCVFVCVCVCVCVCKCTLLSLFDLMWVCERENLCVLM
jgi:hypothetical protein